ncbi:RNA polymerase sigma factor [Stieleria marina]|uniref:ECF RNA polymerase sigma factor SigE n=1 Tax=Stieleria marina TaxID=1930275 RepID=A0A517NPY0_9BACT|nr:ECF RNA polymerase sigma factor SigE [Planctomycetes bacterium K23_9]
MPEPNPTHFADEHSDPSSSANKSSTTRDTVPQYRDQPVQSDQPAQFDQLAPGELIQQHQRGVWRYLRMLGCDDSTADDLTQETFLRVLRRENFVQHSSAATSAYLRRTAYNLLVSDHRKHGRMQTVAEPAVLDEEWCRWAGKDLTGDAAVEALRLCLSKLTERAQLALQMRFAQQASRVDIGKALNITDHGARNLMQRAKQQLRTCVDEQLKTETET